MKIAAITFAAATATALLLAGCSGGSGEANSPAPTPASTSTAIADGPTSTGTPAVGNLDDPLCAAAQDNINDAAALESKTGDLSTMMQDPTFLTGGDSATLNQWGDDMLTLTASTKEFYDLGVAQTAGEDVNADFATLSAFVDEYSIALAQAASDADSTKDFMTTVSSLFTNDDVAEATKAAPAAAQSVGDYLKTRCGLTT